MRQTLVPQQKQKLSLNAYQRQSLHVLSLGADALNEWIAEAAEQNPFLTVDWTPVRQAAHTQVDFAAYTAAKTDPLYDLRFQLHVSGKNQSLCHIAEFYIDALDERGYLPPSILSDATEAYDVSRETARNALRLLQSFEPAGVGARNLRECLYLQLLRESPRDKVALEIIKTYLDALSKESFCAIADALHTSEDTVRQTAEHIRSLHPYPLGHITGEAHYTFPELLVYLRDGDATVVPLQKTPLVQVTDDAEALSAEADGWGATMLSEAHALSDAMRRRQSTLLAIGRQIVSAQQSYFTANAPLAPLTQENVASALSIAVSTVSRSIADKYLQFDGKVYPIKHFFTSGIASGSSREQIKAVIRSIIMNELPEHPVSDGRIARYLASIGQPAAKRTVTKYRQEMEIPNMAQRHAR